MSSTQQMYQSPQQPRSGPPRETWLAYVLWFFLGQIGIHKFYLGQNFMGLIYLGAGVIGWALSGIFIGYLLLIPLWIALIIDAFAMPGQIRQINAERSYW